MKVALVSLLALIAGGFAYEFLKSIFIWWTQKMKQVPPFDPLGVKMPEWDVKTGPAAAENLAQKRSQLSRAKCKECAFVYEGLGADRVGEKHAEINGHQVTFEA